MVVVTNVVPMHVLTRALPGGVDTAVMPVTPSVTQGTAVLAEVHAQRMEQGLIATASVLAMQEKTAKYPLPRPPRPPQHLPL